MTRILVVDDSLVDQRLAGRVLEQGIKANVSYANNGVEALKAIRQHLPDVVVTDLQMPQMDGLELVEAIRKDYATLPVVIMTALGSEELAASALRKGANSYVPKRHVVDDLPKVLRHLLVSKGFDEGQPALECLEELRSVYVLDNDCSRMPSLVRSLKDDLLRIGTFNETEVMHVESALEEAVTNAVHFGNLGLNSDLRDEDPEAFEEQVRKRAGEAPYSQRHVRVTAELTRSEARYTVSDEGKGFDAAKLPDPTDPSQLRQHRKRGLVLIHAFMDDVSHNEIGNEITMIKRHHD